MNSRPMRIGIVNPNTTRSMTDAVIRSAALSARPGTELIAITAVRGVPSIESHVDEVWGALSVLSEVERCEALEHPPDAYVIACFGDTGVPAAARGRQRTCRRYDGGCAHDGDTARPSFRNRHDAVAYGGAV